MDQQGSAVLHPEASSPLQQRVVGVERRASSEDIGLMELGKPVQAEVNHIWLCTSIESHLQFLLSVGPGQRCRVDADTGMLTHEALQEGVKDKLLCWFRPEMPQRDDVFTALTAGRTTDSRCDDQECPLNAPQQRGLGLSHVEVVEQQILLELLEQVD